MDTLILPKTKILLSAHTPLKKILEPLYTSTSVTFFSYVRVYNDNSFIDICDHPEVMEAVYYDKNGLYAEVSPDICPDLLLNEYFLMPCNDSTNPLAKYLNKDIGLSDALIIAKKCKNFHEVFWFGSKESYKFINFCINNLSVLESFIGYFKKKL